MKITRKFLFAATASLIAVAPLLASPEEAKPASDAKAKVEAKAPAGDSATIAFDKTTIDLGDVVKGQTATFTFNFKNTGKTLLKIDSAKPSCGCTVADFTREVKPGESGKVVANIDTSRFKGPITKTVTVTSNDPVNGTVNLQSKANVKAIIDVNPSEQVYLRVLRGDEAPTKRTLTITSDAGNPFEITKVESTNPSITTTLVNLGKAADAPKGGNYQLDVDVKPDAPIGTLTGIITVTTTDAKVPTITLNVNGQVLGEVIVTPPKVYLGQVTPETAETVKRTVRIERRKGNDFKIAKVESSNPAIIAELAPVEDGKVYTLTISIAKGIAVGTINANVVLTTNDKEQSSIEIPVIGSVKG